MSPVRAVWVVPESSTRSLHCDDMDAASSEELESFVPSHGDERERILREIRIRRGQKAFRDKLIEVFNGRCGITGCCVKGVLEAAHIQPYRGEKDNHPSNGLMLRSDLHTLFDLNLLGIEPGSRLIRIHQSARHVPYAELEGIALTTKHELSEAALLQRWQDFHRSSAK